MDGKEIIMTDAINRRDFMKRTTLATVGTSLAMTGLSSRTVLGANDKVVIGLIGCGRQGSDNMRHFMRHGCEVAAVCDVFQPNLDKGLKAAGGSAKTFKDFRELLDNKDIDAVIIGTPDHWHPLPMVEACKAGKDVYVEKPVCVAVEEGKKMVEAARQYKRVVQVGTWQRSNIHFQKAVQVVQEGLVGKISFVRTWNYSNIFPDGIGNPADSEVPAGLDWDFWLGPAPKVAFNQNRFGVGDRGSTFRYFYDYANGWLGDWCVHLLDIVHWAMKVDGPNVITASGSKFYLKDNADVPDTLQVTFEYPGFICTYENRLLNENSMYDHDYGIEFHGSEGTLFVDRGGFKLIPEKKRVNRKDVERTPSMQMEEINDGLADHVANMLECMKTRNRPASDIEIGYRTSAACLLGNVALRSKERIVWDVANQRMVGGSPEAKKLLSREYRAPWKLTV